MAVPSEYSILAPSSIFLKNIFVKSKLTLGNVVIFLTVHDWGLGYSNRFTLCIGCTLHPQNLINLPGSTTGCHTQVYGVRIIKESFPSTYLSTGAYPVELTFPANPGSLPLLSVAPLPRRDNPSVFRPDKSRRILIYYCPLSCGNPDSRVLQTLI
jgi:hypothetical protein